VSWFHKRSLSVRLPVRILNAFLISCAYYISASNWPSFIVVVFVLVIIIVVVVIIKFINTHWLLGGGLQVSILQHFMKDICSVQWCGGGGGGGSSSSSGSSHSSSSSSSSSSASSSMHNIYSYIPQTKYVSRVYSVAAIL
jgi:hypothetical protein